jgi:thiamine-monophosphate kinase
LRRAGARPGDRLFVSGSIGDAGLGLAALTGRLAGGTAGARAVLVDRYRRPRPRLALGSGLLGIAHSAIDVSDGLIADLGHVCRQSGVGATVWLDRVPISTAALAVVGDDEPARAALLAMGDDYELLFAVPPERGAAILGLSAELALPLTEIGTVTASAEAGSGDVVVLGRDGKALTFERRGYRHF